VVPGNIIVRASPPLAPANGQLCDQSTAAAATRHTALRILLRPRKSTRDRYAPPPVPPGSSLAPSGTGCPALMRPLRFAPRADPRRSPGNARTSPSLYSRLPPVPATRVPPDAVAHILRSRLQLHAGWPESCPVRR